MQGLAGFRMVHEHREELLRGAERGRLIRELRAPRREERHQQLRGRARASLLALKIGYSSLPASQAR